MMMLDIYVDCIKLTAPWPTYLLFDVHLLFSDNAVGYFDGSFVILTIFQSDACTDPFTYPAVYLLLNFLILSRMDKRLANTPIH